VPVEVPGALRERKRTFRFDLKPLKWRHSIIKKLHEGFNCSRGG